MCEIYDQIHGASLGGNRIDLFCVALEVAQSYHGDRRADISLLLVNTKDYV